MEVKYIAQKGLEKPRIIGVIHRLDYVVGHYRRVAESELCDQLQKTPPISLDCQTSFVNASFQRVYVEELY